MCRFMCVRVHGQIKGNPLESAVILRHSPFMLGGEGQGLSLTQNLLSRLGWLASEPVFAFQGWDFKGGATSGFVLFCLFTWLLRIALRSCLQSPRIF